MKGLLKGNFLKYIFFGIIAVSVFSCDVIDPNEYMVPIDIEVDTTEVLDNKRIVLIEEFTGHRCPNCPGAAAEAHKLQQLYPGKVLVMCIHSGFYAMPIGEFTNDFRTVEGDSICNYFNPSSFPNSTFCRMQVNGNYLVAYQDWEKLVEEVITQDAIASVEIKEVNYDESSINIKVDTKINSENSINAKVCAFLLESNIIAPQASGDIVDEEFEHNHMLRGAFAGAWGTPVSGIGADSKSLNLYINPEWNLDNCSIIAYVYNSSTLEILQAVEVKLK